MLQPAFIKTNFLFSETKGRAPAFEIFFASSRLCGTILFWAFDFEFSAENNSDKFLEENLNIKMPKREKILKLILRIMLSSHSNQWMGMAPFFLQRQPVFENTSQC